MAEAFCWLFPWNFKEKDISHFLWRSLFYWLFLWNFKKNKASTAFYGTAKLFAVGFTNKPPRKTQYALNYCNIT